MMKLTTLVIATGLLIGGCTDRSGIERSPTQATTQATTQLGLKVVDLRYGNYLARLEVHTNITPDGLLRNVRIDNKSYGPKDLDPKRERREIREGRLTAAQMTDLASLFAGWESLSAEPYGGVPDGGDIQVRYDHKTVFGGSATPKQVWDIQVRINELAAKMPVVTK